MIRCGANIYANPNKESNVNRCANWQSWQLTRIFGNEIFCYSFAPLRSGNRRKWWNEFGQNRKIKQFRLPIKKIRETQNSVSFFWLYSFNLSHSQIKMISFRICMQNETKLLLYRICWQWTCESAKSSSIHVTQLNESCLLHKWVRSEFRKFPACDFQTVRDFIVL